MLFKSRVQYDKTYEQDVLKQPGNARILSDISHFAEEASEFR